RFGATDSILVDENELVTAVIDLFSDGVASCELVINGCIGRVFLIDDQFVGAVLIEMGLRKCVECFCTLLWLPAVAQLWARYPLHKRTCARQEHSDSHQSWIDDQTFHLVSS